jgi:hypothetical protein
VVEEVVQLVGVKEEAVVELVDTELPQVHNWLFLLIILLQ